VKRRRLTAAPLADSFVSMRTVPIERLKDRLGEYIRIAGGGEIVLVTEEDRVVAELGPPRSEEEGVCAEGVRKGWITPARLSTTEPPPRRPVAPLSEIMEELAQDRNDP